MNRPHPFPDRRPPVGARSFTSAAVETALAGVAGRIGDPELAWLFRNCLPNTLDTTVTFTRDAAGRPDTFVITGDIDAMWLRDSTNQVWPYLRYARHDEPLREMLSGLIRRQAACVRLDPYANAFYRDPTARGEWAGDDTEMRPGVHERKYELDSLCAVFRLAHGYWRATGDTAPFDAAWEEAVSLALDTITAEQAGSDEEPEPRYRFRRVTPQALDTLPLGGRGHPSRRCGLSKSPFRPSDDASSLPFQVAANAMAVATLRDLAGLLAALAPSSARTRLRERALELAAEIDAGLRAHAMVEHPRAGRILAYEVDGFGNHLCIDDANVPSLLSLPYLGWCSADDPLYRATRAFVLSEANPYFARGAAGEGIGGPHVGLGWVWPMATTMRALTSSDIDEIAACLRQLRGSHAGTGLMHETFWKDDPARFTRPWFSWANSLFGELILDLEERFPGLLADWRP